MLGAIAEFFCKYKLPGGKGDAIHFFDLHTCPRTVTQLDKQSRKSFRESALLPVN